MSLLLYMVTQITRLIRISAFVAALAAALLIFLFGVWANEAAVSITPTARYRDAVIRAPLSGRF